MPKSQWEEQNRQWHENQAKLNRLSAATLAQIDKSGRLLGALEVLCGIQSEQAFHNELAGALEEHFGVEVIGVTEYDDRGEVFGHPDEIELDVIIKNDRLLICELKSSIDKGGMYMFERKARFYERRHQCTANRLIVISPMIDAQAQEVAQRLGIETYADSIDVEAL